MVELCSDWTNFSICLINIYVVYANSVDDECSFYWKNDVEWADATLDDGSNILWLELGSILIMMLT